MSLQLREITSMDEAREFHGRRCLLRIGSDTEQVYTGRIVIYESRACVARDAQSSEATVFFKNKRPGYQHKHEVYVFE